MNDQKRRKIFLLLVILCCVLNIVFYFYLGYSRYDIQGHWKICRYTLQGYNPYNHINKNVVDEIGRIPKGFSTVPWACVFGNLFYAGFLSCSFAEIYIWILHFVVFLLTAAVIADHLRDHLLPADRIVCILLILAQFSFMYSLTYGNNGAIICLLLADSVLLAQRKPWLSGILLGLALMKPQISGLVALIFLLEGYWTPLIISGIISIAGLASTALMTSTSVIKLLKQFLDSGVASELQYLGLFSALSNLGVDRLVVMLLNMIIGIVYTVLLWYAVKKRSDQHHYMYPFALFSPAFAASVFWVYKNGTDYLILCFICICYYTLLVRQDVSIKDFYVGAMEILYLELSRYPVYAGTTFISDTPLSRALLKGADGMIILLIGIHFCTLWIKYNGRDLKEAETAP